MSEITFDVVSYPSIFDTPEIRRLVRRNERRLRRQLGPVGYELLQRANAEADRRLFFGPEEPA